MSTYRVLLVGSKNRVSDELPSSIERDSGRDVLAEATATISDAISRVAKNGYDAVVCWAEGEDDLAGVIQIRQTRPEQPIVVMTSLRDPSFGELAKEAGATRTAQAAPDPAALSEYIRLTVQSGELWRELRAGARWAHAQALEIRELARRTRAITKEVRAANPKLRTGAFFPLLVEDDPEHAFLMVRAFEKADVLSPLPILKSGEEAIAFLSAWVRGSLEPRPVDPTVVLLDVELPGKSGLEVLEWIRQQPKLSRLPVVMLSCSTNPDHVNLAYQLGANSYLLKPTSFTSLVEMVSSLKQYWGTINFADSL